MRTEAPPTGWGSLGRAMGTEVGRQGWACRGMGYKARWAYFMGGSLKSEGLRALCTLDCQVELTKGMEGRCGEVTP